MNKMLKKFIILLLLIAVSSPAVLPLFQKGFFTTDDGEWMIIRFSAFHQTLRDGEIPVRFLGRLNQEYGYPVANFLYPGFMYLAEPFHLIGFGFVDSIKIMLGLSLILSGICMYLWLRKFFDTFSSSVGALFYVYTPYHLYDLYKRGSVGEMLALTIVPFVLWQIERKSILWSSFGIALLILSHNTLAVLFLPLIILYALIRLNTLYFILFGLGISAFFWIPVVFELQYTVFSQTNVSNWREYFASVALVGYSSFAVLLLVVLFISLKKITLKKHRLTIMLLLFCALSLFLAMPVSSFLWQVLPVGFVQFPFRLLSVTILCVAFLAACSIAVMKNRERYIVGGGLLLVLLFSAFPYLKPATYFDKGEGYYSTNMATTTVLDEYMPVWVKDKPTQRPESKVEIINGRGTIENIIYNNKVISFTVNNEKSSIIRVYTIYWPGWEARVDGRAADISYNNPRGLIEITIPEGRHGVEVKFGETPLRLFSNGISVGSFLLLIFIAGKSVFRHPRAHRDRGVR